MIHFTSSSSPNEIESGEFERQITTNTARMPSFSPLGNIFTKIIPKLIPTGSFYECITELGNRNQSYVHYVIHNYNTSKNIFNLWFDCTELFQKHIPKNYFMLKESTVCIYGSHFHMFH